MAASRGATPSTALETSGALPTVNRTRPKSIGLP